MYDFSQGIVRSGKENPDTKLTARCNNKVANSFKSAMSASVPVKVSGRLNTHPEKVNLQETSANLVKTKVAPRSSTKKMASVILKLEEDEGEAQHTRKKKHRKLPTFERVFNGTWKGWKNKGNDNTGRYFRIQAAMP